ncbi:TatD family hydrolase [Carboxylicivirga sp. A043]|uniref:TatD family hydrolase n=1 Tax=Carboxylicivirga litoralis TaxID=2816963 RepID=UPI0021CAEC0A|nr:TatD family hydrolase [Carboxylicivirga sp. A043]MCU4156653.1 TatD family hydrolase [Carboxylicivirga sp. A043]
MFINTHTHHLSKESGQHPELINCIVLHSEGLNNGWYSIGLHPWNINSSYSEQLTTVEHLAKKPNVLAIGECGIDKLKGPSLEIQTEVFKLQIDLSEELHLPVIIHCVKAYSEIIKIRKQLQPKQAWIFHGFNAPKETMEQALKHGFYFSLGEAILKKNSKASQTLPFIPHNRLFLETDNNPQLHIESIYEKASKLLNLESTQLQLIIQDNFKQLFNVNI